MLEWLIGKTQNHVSELYMWKWAFAHPYLYTLIKVGQPAIIALAVMAVMRKLFAKTRREL